VWHNLSTFAHESSPLRDPQPIRGGCSDSGAPVWLEVDGQRVAVVRFLGRWNLFRELGYENICGFAWLAELANGEQWYIVHDAIRSGRWLGERAS
jgi:hypothetical protein